MAEGRWEGDGWGQCSSPSDPIRLPSRPSRHPLEAQTTVVPCQACRPHDILCARRDPLHPRINRRIPPCTLRYTMSYACTSGSLRLVVAPPGDRAPSASEYESGRANKPKSTHRLPWFCRLLCDLRSRLLHSSRLLHPGMRNGVCVRVRQPETIPVDWYHRLDWVILSVHDDKRHAQVQDVRELHDMHNENLYARVY